MPLWRVDISAVSHRYVDAASENEAVAQVEQAMLRALDIRATRAHPRLKSAYEALGPIQRKNMLARIDGLTNPQERKAAKAARRQLERMIDREREEEEWARSALAGVPPISPATADRIAQIAEISHIEHRFSRLPEWDRSSPLHSEE